VSSVRTIGVGQIRWNKDSILKLTTILARQPLPRNREIALEMGVTLTALQTAMSRFGLSPHSNPVWNEQTLMKLSNILARDQIPSNGEIAVEMGVTLTALGTAMTKFGMSPYRGSKNSERIYQNESFRVDTRRMRDCLCCEKPFGSDGIHDRLCDECGNSNGEIDVTECQLGV
jgi:hypothetical protein